MIRLAAENVLHLLAIGALLVVVAFFSGAETSLFTLTRHQLKTFRAGANPLLRLAARLLDRPQETLVTILLGNMSANVLFFASASVLVISSARYVGGVTSAVLGVVPALAIIFFGGVLPKVFAAAYPAFVAGLVAGPLYGFHRVIRPVCVILQRGLVTPGVRLLTPPGRGPRPVGHAELNELLEHSAAQGLLAPGESELLREVVELGTIRAREIVVPRVDMITFDITQGREAFLDLVRAKRVKRVPAWRDQPDNIVGMLHARDVLLKPDDPLEDLLRPAWFVPEAKTIDGLLRDFQHTGREIAIAVDEYGGITGLLTLEDVIAEVVGEVFELGEGPPPLVRQIGEDAWLVSGRLSIREWAEAFGQRFADFGVDTIGGLIAVRLGRVARVGDALKLRNLLLTVTRVLRHRIVEVRLDRIADDADGRTAPAEPKEPPP